MGVSTATAIAISTTVAVVAVVSTVAASTLNVVDIWCEVDNPMFNTFQKAFNIISTVSNLTYSVGNLYNSIKGIKPQDYIAQHPGKSTVQTTRITSTNDLSPKQADAFAKYSNSDYSNINDSLRGLDTPTPENAKRIQIMKDTLNKSSFPEDTVLYRGTSTNALGDLKNLSPEDMIGKSFIEDGFMSTSRSNFVAKSFTGDMHMTILAPEGAPALDIAPISGFPSESEYLFNAGQKMLILDAQKIKDILYITVHLK